MFLDPQLVNDLQRHLADDLFLFLPELILCSSIVFLLLLRLVPAIDRMHLGMVALACTLVAMAAAVLQWVGGDGLAKPFFGGMLAYDNFTVYLRIFLIAFTATVIWLSLLTGIPDAEDSGDFYCLLLGAVVGMCLMASANHLLMVFLAIEMASLPSYALAGFLKGKRQSSEAALKYVVYGGGAAGIMLYGISLLVGKFGTGYLPDLAKGFEAILPTGAVDPIVLLGLLMLLIGIGFKLAAVPFHFWCPDVFEGAAAEVAGFLSVASKAGALALLGRLTLVLAGLSGRGDPDTWLRFARFLVPALALAAAVTATFGNLAAYSQTNLKRLLAYSTIAHAGYMMMGLATLTPEGAAAVLFYLIAYFVMNLGAFAVVAFVRNRTGSEDLSAYSGLMYRSPVLAVAMSLFLLSLIGLPPLGGFAAKFLVFRALFDAGQLYTTAGAGLLGYTMYALLLLGGINSVLSLVYYINVLKVMIFDRPPEEAEGKPIAPVTVTPGWSFYVTAMSGLIVIVGLFFNPFGAASAKGVAAFKKIGWPASVAEVRK
jgi:NADH-quinone oxidoreductase subunit N